MAKEIKIEILTNARDVAKKQADEALQVVKDALAEKSLDAYNKGMTVLSEKVKVYNDCLCKVKYAELLATENPMIEAVKAFYVDTVKVKEKRDENDGFITDVSLESKKSRIDLEKFCEFGELDTSWARSSAELLNLLALRETDVFNIKPSELAKKSYYFIAQVKKKQDGETPDSNTQIVRLLQRIIDEAIFVDNGEGKNVYKCTNHDIAFIQDAVTKMDTKEKCTIAMLNERQFKTVMMSVFAHCLGEAYKVKVAKPKNA